jgi:hypothetical protein
MASITKRWNPSAFQRLGLLYLFLNFPNIKHIASLYNLENELREKHPPFAIQVYMDDKSSFTLPLFLQVSDNGPT